jgi:TonB family protein
LARKWAISGLARLSCREEFEGRVSGCRVTGQDPLNMGFGAAALKMQHLYRVDPEHLVGWREGFRVAFVVPFRLLPPAVEGPSDWLPPARPLGRIPVDVIAKAYPPRAKALRVEGSTTISCVNTPAGQLIKCEVGAENPPEWGFGDAALRLVPLYFKAPDQTGGDHPFVMRAYRVPVRFKLPPE